MTYVLLIEGTGKGVHERTNVSVLADACVQDPASVVIHDSQNEATNIWGLLPSPSRVLSHLREHPLCKAVKMLESACTQDKA